MSILVTGADGQLGYDVMKILESRKIPATGTVLKDFDLSDSAAVKQYIEDYSPDTVIHCGAYTAVDRAEDERELCMSVNAGGTRAIAETCGKIGAKMIYISTDYVFDGTGAIPWNIGDKIDPLNYYGLSKYRGEEAVRENLEKYFIVRTSWVFGINGHNFVRTMLRLAETKDEVSVVDDQVGSPTYTPDLARLLCDMAQTDKYGTYHATNEGFCSWAEFAQEIFIKKGLKTRVIPIDTASYPSRAARPANSRMSKSSLTASGFDLLPPWQDALARYFAELESAQ